MSLPQFYIDDIIKRAITEDINYVDVTTDYLISDDAVTTAKYVAKDTGVVAGVDIAVRVYQLLDDSIQYEILKKDGDTVQKGDIILTLTGKTKTLLKGERTSLNLIQHMSGIATMTNKCVQLTKGTNCTIADTRKTLPGLRALQKYAVTVGGGLNHRFNLSDGAMLKDNHIDAYGSMPADMAKAVEITAGRAKLEASGNITLENIAEVAQTGVDIISLGALTHSVRAFDISMKIAL